MRVSGLGTLARAGLVLLLAGAGAVAILLVVSSSDVPGVQSANGPGKALPDSGAESLPAGKRAPPGNPAHPPTSGAHAPAAITRDGAPLSNDQLLDALERGDVVILYDAPRPPAPLGALAAALAPPFSPALAAAGGAVILAPRAGVGGIVAVAWRHLLRVADPRDPALGQFVDFWLGRGRR